MPIDIDPSQLEPITPDIDPAQLEPVGPRKTGAYVGPPPAGIPAGLTASDLKDPEAFVRRYATVPQPAASGTIPPNAVVGAPNMPADDFSGPIQNVRKRYPGLAKLPITVTKGSGPYYSETYMPWDEENPVPGKLNIQLRKSKDAKGQDLEDSIASESLHLMGALDPSGKPYNPDWYALKQKLRQALSPRELELAKKDWKEEQLRGEPRRSFDQYMQSSHLDMLARGYLFPENQGEEWVQRMKNGEWSPKEREVLEQMRGILQPPAYDTRAVEQLEGGGLQAPTIDPVDLLTFGGIGALESIPESIGEGAVRAGVNALRQGLGSAAGVGLMSKTGQAIDPAIEKAIPGQGPLSEVARGTVSQLASTAPLIAAGTLGNLRLRGQLAAPYEEPESEPPAGPTETPVQPPTAETAISAAPSPESQPAPAPVSAANASALIELRPEDLEPVPAEAPPVDLSGETKYFGKPLHEMTPEELDRAFDLARTDDDRTLENLFGKEGAKNYKRLDRIANSTSRSHEETNRASDELERMAERLNPDQRKQLYGERGGAYTPNLEEVAGLRKAVLDVDTENPVEMGRSLRWALTRLPKEDVSPEQMNMQEREAYAQLRFAYGYAREHGWDLRKVSDAAVKSAAARFSDPADAIYMLQRFFKNRPEGTAAPLELSPEELEPVPTQVSAVPPKLAPALTHLETDPNPRIAKVNNFPVDQIGTNPDTFQYKEGYEKGTGAGLALNNIEQFDPGLAGRLTLYRWPDGHVDVLNGHQRLAAMKRFGVPTADVQILDSKNYTHEQARAYGARINIAEGRGTALDAATFMRVSNTSPEQLRREGIDLSEAKTSDAAALYNLADPLFRAVKMKTLQEHTATVIGRELPDNKPAQEAILKSIRELEPRGGISDAKLTETIRLAKGGQNVTEEQTDLFGKRTLEQSLVPQQADILAHVREQLGKDKRLFGTVARERGRLESGGTNVDIGQATGISEGAATRLLMLDRSAYSSGTETNSILQKYAKLLKNSPKGARAGVLKDAYAEIFDALNKDYQQAFTTAAPLPGAAPEAGPGQGNLLTGATAQPKSTQPQETKPELPEFFYHGIRRGNEAAIRQSGRVNRGALTTDPSLAQDYAGPGGDVVKVRTQDLLASIDPEMRDRYEKYIAEDYAKEGHVVVEPPWGEGPGVQIATEPNKGNSKGFTELGGSFLPGAKQFIEKDIVPSAKQAAATLRGARDSIARAFAPASMSPEAAHSAGITRKYSGILAADRERAARAFEQARNYMETLPAADQTEFIDRIERGQPQPNLEQQQIADSIRKLLDTQRDEVQKLGQQLKKPLLKTFYENYFPHIWKDPAKAEQVYNGFGSKGSLEGGKNFLKHRSFDYYIEGLQHGLEPVTSNPVDMALLKHYEMSKFLRGQRIFRDLRDADYVKFVKFGEKPPADYVKLNDKIARVYQYSEHEKGFINRGEYYVPEPVGRIVNNYLSPGLRGDALYDALRGGSNIANRMQLGFSAFHLGTTAVNASTSDVALGLMKIAHGEPIAGLKHIGRGLSGASIVADVMRGREGYREFYSPGSIGGKVADRVADYIEANGKIGVDRQFVDGWAQSFKDALRESNVLGAVVRSPLAAAETMGKPLFDYIIPRAKLGAFMDLAEEQLGKLPPNATEADRLAVIDRVQNSIDSRFGMLQYDNLFWNNKWKDAAFLLMRAPGWNIGTAREIGGAVFDLAARRGLTPKVAYAIALPLTAMVSGAAYQYARTGKFPQFDPNDLRQSWINFTKPETGRMLPNGQPERVQFPSYLKDIEGMTEHPGKTIVDKLNPVASMLADLYQNKDYEREEIRHPGDPALQQAGQVGEFVGKELLPFSVQNLMRRRDQSVTGQPVGQGVESYLGVTPAPREFTNSKAQNLMQQFEEQNIPEGARTADQVEHSKLKRQILQQLRTGQKQPLHDALAAGQITRREAHHLGQDSLEKPFAVEFKRLTLPQAVEVYKAGTDQEKDAARPFLLRKFKHNLVDVPLDQRPALLKQLQTIEIEWLLRKKKEDKRAAAHTPR